MTIPADFLFYSKDKFTENGKLRNKKQLNLDI